MNLRDRYLQIHVTEWQTKSLCLDWDYFLTFMPYQIVTEYIITNFTHFLNSSGIVNNQNLYFINFIKLNGNETMLRNKDIILS